MVGGLRCVVYMSSVIQIGQGVTALCGVENGPFLLLWPVAYTTACTSRDIPCVHYSHVVLFVPICEKPVQTGDNWTT